MRSLLRDPVVIVFGLVSLIFFAIAGWLAVEAQKVTAWPTVAATVVESRVLQVTESEFQGGIEVRYRAGGQEKTKALRTNFSSSSTSLVEQALASYPAGATVQLPLNPDDPEDLRLTPSFTETWLLPLVLATGGLLFILVPVGVAALSARENALTLAGWIFVALGLGAVALGGALGLVKVKVLKTWPQVEAGVVSSQEGVRRGRRGPLKGIDLVFAYAVDGRDYQTATGSSGGTSSSAWVEEQLSMYAPGTRHLIRYSPTNPGVVSFEAAWTPGYFWETLALALSGLTMMALGGAMVRFLGRNP